ncbi:MAG TPA: hypothetical protein VGD58_09730 [Herpetosiphonaceae bacterium]
MVTPTMKQDEINQHPMHTVAFARVWATTGGLFALPPVAVWWRTP